jgi:hypothetical protein
MGCGMGFLRPLFSWKYSTYLIPMFLIPAALAMSEHQYWVAKGFVVLAGFWALGQWVCSESRKRMAADLNRLEKKAEKYTATQKSISEYARACRHYGLYHIAVVEGLILITMAGIFWVNDIQVKYELSLPYGWLRPAKELTPPNACHDIPKGALTIILGNQTAYATKFPITVMSINGKPVLTLDKNQAGEAAITTNIYDEKEWIVVKIKDNEIKIDNDVFSYDKHNGFNRLTIEIKYRKEMVLDVHYLNPSTLKIMGIFRLPGNPTLRVTTDGAYFKNSMTGGNCVGMHGGGTMFAFSG